jgi:ABC-type polysaccharide/polyol phosphate export permease
MRRTREASEHDRAAARLPAEGCMTAAFAPIADLFRFRELVTLLVARDLKVRYKRSVLGMLWTLLNPLLQMAVYTFVFSMVMRVNVPGYPVYLMSGLLPWILVSSAATCAHALVANQGLIKKVAVPQAVYPLSIVASKLVDVVLSFVPLALVGALMGRPPTASWVVVPAALVVAAAFTAGFALMFSSLTVFFHDLKHLVDILFQIWFYVTPIFYPYQQLEQLARPWLRTLLSLNPATPIVRLFQVAVYEGRFPGAVEMAAAAGVAVASLAIGFAAFARAEPHHIHHF